MTAGTPALPPVGVATPTGVDASPAPVPPAGPPRGWRLGPTVTEGTRSALASRWTGLVMLALTVWTLAVPAAVDARQVQRLVVAERAWVQAGGRVMIVSADRQGGVPRMACERVARLDGVRAAGSISRDTAEAAFTFAPDQGLPLVWATSGIWRLVGAYQAPAPVLLSPGTGSALGLSTGRRVAVGVPRGAGNTSHAPSTVVVTIHDLDVLGEKYAGAAIMPVTPVGVADACYVEADAGHLAAVEAALPTLLSVNGHPATVASRLEGGRFADDYLSDFRQRPLRSAWIPCGLLVGAVWMLLLWVRRGQSALYTTLGAGLVTRSVIRGVEWTILVVLASVWAMAAGVSLAVALDVPLALAVPMVARHVAASLLTATVLVAVSLLLPSGSTLSALKDR